MTAREPMTVLGFDTATPATAVALVRADSVAFETRHDPGPGERPGHARELLPLVDQVARTARVGWDEITLLAVGTGPGSFTGLRIGIATARALAQTLAVPVAGVPTLRALAEAAAEAEPGRPILAAVDARRGEAFAAAWSGEDELLGAGALRPEELAARAADLPGTPLAVGDGAVEFRSWLEAVGAVVPPDGSPLHRVGARYVCRLATVTEPTGGAAVLPEYLRQPDARPPKPR
jgi:tRNA threonylcarbamoyladenosine biosynthesis protein TsaB